MTGGNPAASSAGKVTIAAPPTIAAMTPPAMPAPTSSTMWSEVHSTSVTTGRTSARGQKNAWMPVCARPRISAWMSWVPS